MTIEYIPIAAIGGPIITLFLLKMNIDEYRHSRDMMKNYQPKEIDRLLALAAQNRGRDRLYTYLTIPGRHLAYLSK